MFYSVIKIKTMMINKDYVCTTISKFISHGTLFINILNTLAKAVQSLPCFPKAVQILSCYFMSDTKIINIFQSHPTIINI